MNSKIGKAVNTFINILLKVLKDKGRLEAHIDIQIQENIPTAENYIALNELIPNSWRLAPITSLPKKNYKHCMQWWKARMRLALFWKVRTLILETNRGWSMPLEQKLLQSPS
ncbi:hypothetical protein KI688_004143 [Linnemannia hyalina]|uniref:Uncharacterized protein n=1 Tax=Linnemannia hyalina TaxID=64524 RepID=A0A9P8BPP4_9FUNG|nr:hypothetical protein KI688_004143 [Linnemannia hyalina]